MKLTFLWQLKTQRAQKGHTLLCTIVKFHEVIKSSKIKNSVVFWPKNAIRIVSAEKLIRRAKCQYLFDFFAKTIRKNSNVSSTKCYLRSANFSMGFLSCFSLICIYLPGEMSFFSNRHFFKTNKHWTDWMTRLSSISYWTRASLHKRFDRFFCKKCW